MGVESQLAVKIRLPEIRHNQAGFEALVRFYSKTEESLFDDIEIDMGDAGWFDADMCAPLGALLYKLSDRMNTLELRNIPRE